MLIVTAHNIEQSTPRSSNYDIKVYVNQTYIWTGKVKDHDRQKGWPNLLRMIAEEAEKHGEKWRDIPLNQK